MDVIASIMLNTQSTSLETERRFRPRFLAWVARGASTHAATVLADAGCETFDDIRRLGRDYFESFRGCGKKTLQELSLLAGWQPKIDTAADAIAAALSLTISDPDEAYEAARDAVIALTRAGFVIAVSDTAPAGRR